MKHKLSYKSILLSALLLMMFASSCNDWLTLPPEDKLIKEKFWTKTEDVEGSIAAMYDAFREETMKSFIMGELRADMISNIGSSFSDYKRIAESNISASNPVVSWNGYYNAINLANTLMYYNKQVLESDETFTKDMMDAVDAEALFIRSLSFFYLTRLWKDVPLTITPSISDTSNLFIPKSSEKQVLRQIIKDLKVARELTLNNSNDLSNSVDLSLSKGRANKYSIMALLADVYLWDEQYENCIQYCDEIINSGIFMLEPDETSYFNLFYPGNSPIESIFEIQYADNLDQKNPMYNELYRQIVTDRQSISSVLTIEDLRNLNPDGVIPRPLWKYNGQSLYGIIPRSSNQQDANFIYYRYADVLLMKAEALTELDRIDEANNVLKLTKERAGLSHTNLTDKEDLRDELLNERAREFLLEGKRWFDLLRAAKRNNFESKHIIIEMILAGADIKQQPILRAKVFDTLSYYLPIPENDLRYNQNLVQNPYYDR